METKKLKFTATHITKKGFGGLLAEGRKVQIIKESEGGSVFVFDSNNYWHGNKKDLEILNN